MEEGLLARFLRDLPELSRAVLALGPPHPVRHRDKRHVLPDPMGRNDRSHRFLRPHRLSEGRGEPDGTVASAPCPHGLVGGQEAHPRAIRRICPRVSHLRDDAGPRRRHHRGAGGSHDQPGLGAPPPEPLVRDAKQPLPLPPHVRQRGIKPADAPGEDGGQPQVEPPVEGGGHGGAGHLASGKPSHPVAAHEEPDLPKGRLRHACEQRVLVLLAKVALVRHRSHNRHLVPPPSFLCRRCYAVRSQKDEIGEKVESLTFLAAWCQPSSGAGTCDRTSIRERTLWAAVGGRCMIGNAPFDPRRENEYEHQGNGRP